MILFDSAKINWLSYWLSYSKTESSILLLLSFMLFFKTKVSDIVYHSYSKCKYKWQKQTEDISSNY